MQQRIVDRWDATRVLYECEAETLGAAVLAAVKSRANLSRADLSGANLSGANLSRAYLSRANLSGANLSRAYLSRANLSEADLSRAYLSRANLSEADLSGANLSEADLSGATGGILFASVRWTDHGERGRQLLGLYLPALPAAEDREAREASLLYHCGCFRGTEDKLRAYIASGAESLRASRTLALDFVAARMAEMLAKREIVRG